MLTNYTNAPQKSRIIGAAQDLSKLRQVSYLARFQSLPERAHGSQADLLYSTRLGSSESSNFLCL